MKKITRAILNSCFAAEVPGSQCFICFDDESYVDHALYQIQELELVF